MTKTTAAISQSPSYADDQINTRHHSSRQPITGDSDIVVVGGAVVDLIGRISTSIHMNSSNPGKLIVSHGGVGRNIAESLAKLGTTVSLATAVANDSHGNSILERSERIGINMSLTKILPSTDLLNTSTEKLTNTNTNTSLSKRNQGFYSTAVYNAIHDNTGDLRLGLADMSIFSEIDASYIASLNDAIDKAKLVVSDGNISKDSFIKLVDLCFQLDVPVFFEPTSDHKCMLPLHAGRLHKVCVFISFVVLCLVTCV
jgi:pseudouridine kinase